MCLTYDKEIAPKMFGYRIKFIKEKMTQFQGNGKPSCKQSKHDKLHLTKTFKDKIS